MRQTYEALKIDSLLEVEKLKGNEYNYGVRLEPLVIQTPWKFTNGLNRRIAEATLRRAQAQAARIAGGCFDCVGGFGYGIGLELTIV